MGGKQSFPMVKLSKDTVVVITGANTGIGYTTAKWIAMLGASVIIACRSEDKAMQAIRRIDAEFKEAKEKGASGITDSEVLSIEYMNLDLASFKSTEDFVDAFKKTKRPLHVLICNAGITKSKLEKTEDGFETMLQVNYLSHFLLIGKLLPLMKKTAGEVRIVLVSSDAHKLCGFDLAKMNYDGPADKLPAFDYYGRSKLYQVMQMYSLDRRLKNSNVSVTSLHPGTVETEIGREFVDNKGYQIFVSVTRFLGFMKNCEDGAVTTINAAVNPALKGVGGVYYKDCNPVTPSGKSRDLERQQSVWTKTLEYLGSHLTEDELFCLEGEDPQ